MGAIHNWASVRIKDVGSHRGNRTGLDAPQGSCSGQVVHTHVVRALHILALHVLVRTQSSHQVSLARYGRNRTVEEAPAVAVLTVRVD